MNLNILVVVGLCKNRPAAVTNGTIAAIPYNNQFDSSWARNSKSDY